MLDNRLITCKISLWIASGFAFAMTYRHCERSEAIQKNLQIDYFLFISYDPYGMRVNPTDWSQKDSRTSFVFARGYTMHEHLDDFGLINMNGRMYDPQAGQFLSPDPYVQAPGNWYNYNRYAYGMNNPLIYSDPDGEWNWLVAGIGFIYGYVSYGLMNNDWGWEAAANGALSGAMWGFGYTKGVEAAGISPLSYAGQSAISSTVNYAMPSTSVPITDKFSINASPAFGLGPNGFTPAESLPTPDNWLKEEKWIWRNEKDWEEYKNKIKKK